MVPWAVFFASNEIFYDGFEQKNIYFMIEKNFYKYLSVKNFNNIYFFQYSDLSWH
jgi:hypothetical protein